MAEVIRIIRGDTVDIEFEVLDDDDNPVSLAGWNIQLQSDSINKNSVDDPNDFVIESGSFTEGQGSVTLTSEETNPRNQRTWCNPTRSHYKLRMYQDDNPAVVKTFSTGDLIFVQEL